MRSLRGAALLLISLLGLLAACSSCSASTQPAKSLLEVNDGFCPQGTYPLTTWPEGKPTGIETWGSFCNEGDANAGSAASRPFSAPPAADFYLAGYPGTPGVTLSLQNLTTHSELSIAPHEVPATRWLKYRFVLPSSWVGKPVVLVAKDAATGPGGWLAFSGPLPAPAIWDFGEAANLLLRTTTHFFLLFIPCFALCAFAVSKGLRDIVVLGLIALIGVAAPGYLVFWLWLFSPRIGHAVAFLIPIAGGGYLAFLLRRLGRSGLKVLKPLLLPAGLVFFSSLSILSAGFAFGGTRAPFVTASTRFSHPLPPDNMIPFLFAEGVRTGPVPSPLLGDWLSSDRPPLQTGIALSQYPYMPQPRALGHTALSVVLQSTWILSVWILLVAFEIERRAIALVLATVLFSGFTLVNSFFIWPKLLAGTYIVALSAILLVDSYFAQLQKSNLLCLLAGGLTAFGLLAHGGSIFALIGLCFTLILGRRFASGRALALMFLTLTLLYLPWVLYQKFYDPPGDHLLKEHLAGIEKHDGRGLTQVIGAAYSKLTFGDWLAAKHENLMMVAGHQNDYWRNVRSLFTSMATNDLNATNRAASDLRSESFFYFSSSLGFLIVGPFVLLAGVRRRHRNDAWRAAALLWIVVVCTCAAWCLIMFTAGSTSIHQGAYAAVLWAMAAAILALWAASPRLAYVACGLQILQSILIYGSFMRESPSGNSLLEGAPHYGIITLFFLTSLVSGLLLVSSARKRMPTRDVGRREPIVAL